MADKTFNLLDEPWIRVIYPDCREEEVSLKQIFAEAHTYTDLAGELPTQNVAMLRLLLAVLHAVFYRVDETGKPAEITCSDDAYDRWQALWEMGHFPTKPIHAYLEQWRDRFDLLDEARPFYQVVEAKIGTEYTSAKLNGEISESGNKKRLFPGITGEEKDVLSYAEAARWLLYVNGFDDTSAKPKGKDLPSVGAGWLGKLGLIQTVGKNLFETLMLNLVLVNENDEPWEVPCPMWELNTPRSGERIKISWPDNQAALLTLQSRRLLLTHENDRVVGYYLLGGDFFDKENAFCEQMTVWRPVLNKKREQIGLQPARHNPERKMWQDFSSIAASREGRRKPGVVYWLNRLIENDCLPYEMIGTYRIASVQYGDKDFFVTDVFEDSLTFHLNLLSEELNGKWIDRITSEISGCEELARAVGHLASDLDKSAGGDGLAAGERAKEQFFYRIDMPFRNWLRTLDATQSDVQREEKVEEWRNIASRIADRIGQELVRQAGPAAFQGKAIKVEKDSTMYFCAPDAYRYFRYRLGKYNPIKDKGDE